MSQPSLIAVLAITVTEVKIITSGNESLGKISPRKAFALVMRYPERYEWGGTKRRVKWLRDKIDTTPVWLGIRDDKCWRSSGAAVCPPAPGYYEARRSQAV